MCPTRPAELSELLAQWGQGDGEARDALISLIYKELRGIERRSLYRERSRHTLPGAVSVNEAYLRMTRQQREQFENRGCFFAFATARAWLEREIEKSAHK